MGATKESLSIQLIPYNCLPYQTEHEPSNEGKKRGKKKNNRNSRRHDKLTKNIGGGGGATAKAKRRLSFVLAIVCVCVGPFVLSMSAQIESSLDRPTARFYDCTNDFYEYRIALPCAPSFRTK